MELSLPDGTKFLVDTEDIPKIFNQAWHVFHSRENTYIRGWDKIKKKLYLGRFNTPGEAALAYNEAALKYFGEFARINQL